MRKKKWTGGILLAAAFTAALFGLAACSQANAPTEISVGRNNMPRLTYVQGQELDLSKGTLTVVYGDGGTESLPLDSAQIAASGYDKNALGTQTVTLTYEGLTAQIIVNVIARLTVVNAQTVYYVGEELDRGQGSLTFADDDAVTTSVPFSSEALTFTGFDSSAPAASQTVTVTYTLNGQSYSAGYDVTVYTTENAKLTAPQKTVYFSHEDFRINGAYITYSNGDPAYTKTIPVTLDMVTGIDFTAVTADNSPLIQTGTVHYGGREYTFEISITYSAVTRLQQQLARYAFTWTDPAAIDEETGTGAQACIVQYAQLTTAQRAYIDQESIRTAARAAAAYTYGAWELALASHETAFVIDGEGLRYRLESYDAARAAYDAVTQDASALNAGRTVMEQLLALFPSLTVGDVEMEDYLAYATLYAEQRENLTKVLGLTTSLFEAVQGVPADWTAEGLSAYAEQIDAARDAVTKGEFASGVYREVYALVSGWREKDDLFTILYTHYVQTQDNTSLDALKDIILPPALEALFGELMEALVYHSAISEGSATDTSFAVYSFEQALAGAQEIVNGADGLNKTLYETLLFEKVLIDSATQEAIPTSFDDLISYVRGTVYVPLMYGTFDDAALAALWEKQFAVMDAQSSEEAKPLLLELLNGFAALSAGQQASFLYSMNYYYSEYEGKALDLTTDHIFLTRALRQIWSEALTEPEYEAFGALLLAMESYANAGGNGDYLTAFFEYFEQVQTAYEQMGADSVFRTDFGALVEQYATIAALYGADGALKEPPVVSGEWQAVFDALGEAISNILIAQESVVKDEDGMDVREYVRVFASYERARAYAVQLLASDDATVLRAYYSDPASFGTDAQWTFDYAMNVVASWSALSDYAMLSFGSTSLIDVVADHPALRTFLSEAAPVLWAEGGTQVSAQDAVAVMQKLLALSNAEQNIFLQLQAYHPTAQFYYDGLSAVLGAALGTGADAALQALFDAEQAFVAHAAAAEATAQDPSDEEAATELTTARTALDEAMAALEEAVAALAEGDVQSFQALLGGILSHYRTAYAQLGSAQDAAAESAA